MTVRTFRVTLVLAAVAALAVAAPAAQAKTRVVKPGHSIQAKINHSKPGDTVLVKPGTYAQSLAITKNRITLRGKGVTLTEPANAPNTQCNGGGAVTGICVTGQGDFNAGTVSKYVNRVRILGIRVKGFSGDGIFAFGASRLTVSHVKLRKNKGYGVFALVSKRTRYLHNSASGNGDAGFYLGDSPSANAIVAGNRSVGNAMGVLFRHAKGADIHNNVLDGNCAGVIVLADAPGPAGKVDVHHNKVRKNNRSCPGESGGEPPLSGVGIALSGAFGSKVRSNVVKGNKPSATVDESGGILVLRGDGGTAPKNNTISRNLATGNTPADIHWDGSGTGNKFKKNRCNTSDPSGLCTKP